MIRNLYHCDACKEAIPDVGDVTELTVETGALVERFEAVHLCPGCEACLIAWLLSPNPAFLRAPLAG